MPQDHKTTSVPRLVFQARGALVSLALLIAPVIAVPTAAVMDGWEGVVVTLVVWSCLAAFVPAILGPRRPARAAASRPAGEAR